jgi:hypothetical protein
MKQFCFVIAVYLAGAVAARAQQLAPTWEYVSVRVLSSVQNPPAGTTTTLFYICRGGKKGCSEEKRTSEGQAYWENQSDAALVELLNELGRQGFEVTGALPYRQGASTGAVLLKRPRVGSD